jgi:[acyl-carrier-protein] S-malonyltransferase
MVDCVLLCPGQGAQKVGMGRDLAERFPAAREVFDAVDAALQTPLSRLMWEGPDDELTLTHNAQPAILTHSLAVWAVVGNALAPRLGAGHSLGEYSAYAAAGALEPGDAVRLVRRRGELMLEAGQARAGTMAAVMGLDADVVADACERSSTADSVVVAANLNAPGQVVISGDPAAVERVTPQLTELGAKRVLPLNVSGAFHSPLMEPAVDGLQAALDGVDFGDPTFPVVANATAEPTASGEAAREQLARQLTAPVRWIESMQRARVEVPDDVGFVEVGPGNVLSGLLKRIDRGASSIALGTAEQVSAFMEQHG